MAAASSAADVSRQQKYDVFLSFRGKDTRHKFTSHLKAALDRKKIYTYIDYRLERGDEIGPALLTAIVQSKLSVIIFSKDYASSSWCLDELVHILKCKQEYGQLVLPVFYDIDPAHVRWQKGTYADAFAILENRFKDNMEKVRKWRDALTTASYLRGVRSQDNWDECELVETIVTDILGKLNRNSSYVVKGLVGMESRIQQIELLLCIHAQDVCYRTIGIWGMGGMGKTTLADVVFHQNKFEFDACLFLANVREESEKHGLHHLRNELLSELMDENLSIGSPSIGSSCIIDRLSRTKVLVVLDDVSDLSQLETLLGDQVKFGRGSRIIITTRNRRLLKKRVHEDHIYKMTELCVDEALQLFQAIAFEEYSCITDYSYLSREVVGYAGCNPLALKVLASSFLHCNNREDWKGELEKLKKFPNTKIQNMLRISYNGLEENEKGIFLDIACFLKGENMCDAKKLLEMRGFSASPGIRVLIDMSLISIINNCLEMHDLLQEMGRAIDRGIEEPGIRKRLWNAADAYQVLHNNTGTSTIEAIFLDVSKIRELQLSPAAFRNMHNLKLLKFYATQEVHRERKGQRRRSVEEKQLSSFPVPKVVQSFLAWGSLKLLDVYRRVCNCDDKVFNEDCKVYLPGGLESLPEVLKYLYWERYPLKSLPSQFSPENLVELHLPHSQVKRLWNNVQNLGSLKRLNLSDSPHLIEVPDLSGSPNIERIDLSGCRSLVEVPSQFQNLGKLTDLKLQGCTNLKKVCVQNLGSLKCLNLSDSPHLIEVPDLSGSPNIERIDLSGCRSLVEVPSQFQNLGKLIDLKLQGCTNLKKVCVQNLGSLKCLNLSGSSHLIEVPDLSGSPNIERIDLSGCRSLVEVPSQFQNLGKLTDLKLQGCTNLKKVCVQNLGSLKCLNLSDSPHLIEVPDLSGSPNIERIDLSGCRSLVEVPSQFQNLGKLTDLDLYDCTNLKKVCVQNLGSLKCLDLSDSPHLIEVPDLSGSPNIERIYLRGCTSLVEVPSYFQNLKKLAVLDLYDCTNLKKFCELPCNLVELHLNWTAIEEISPSIWSHENLRKLKLGFCKFIESFPRRCSSGTSKLKCLKLTGCSVVESVPDSLLSLSTLEDIDLSESMIESIPSSIINASGLRRLCLTNCKKLKVIPELPWQLYNLEAACCTSLKSVASSRSALMQQPWVPYEDSIYPVGPFGNYHNYTNCLELDESARRNIMDDAQLRILRMASSSSNHDRDVGFTAFCPGNELPGWFSYDYQCEGCELNNIQFPKTKTTGTGPMKEISLNFVVSAVVSISECALNSYGSARLVCDCNFKTNDDGKGYRSAAYESPMLWGPIRWSHNKFEKGHVVTFFKRNALPRCEENSITQASFHLYLFDANTYRGENRLGMKVKKVWDSHIVKCKRKQ